MHPLQELFDLYENDMNVVDKPQLRNTAGDFAIGTKNNTGVFEHPVIRQRQEVDDLRNQGVPIEIAHQQVHGNMDMGNIQSKADLAATLGRAQEDGTRRGLKLDMDSPFKSLLARDAQVEKQIDQVTRNDLRTPMPQQVPDSQQMPSQEVAEGKKECGEGEYFCNDEQKCKPIPKGCKVDSDGILYTPEEYDYNLDVAYLQTYGRA